MGGFQGTFRPVPPQITAFAGLPDSARQLRSQDVDRTDVGRLADQVASLGHQCLGDATLKMGLAAGIGREHVEDSVAERPHLDGNQAVVSGSAFTSASPPSRNRSKSASLPGFASRRTSSPTVTMIDTSFCVSGLKLPSQRLRGTAILARIETRSANRDWLRPWGQR